MRELWPREALLVLALVAGLVSQRAADGSDPTADDVYDIGVGIADVTGPAAGVNMMGYANPSQTTHGIHTRLFSRSFVIGQGGTRWVFISIDGTMGSQMVKRAVVKRLSAKYGSLYTERNVCLSATHTHSAPAGFLDHVLYLITSLGFIRQSFDGLVEGIVKSIERAHANIRRGHVLIAEGHLKDAGLNRSPTAYMLNPAAERDRYPHNVDTQMLLLKMVDLEQKPLGVINWFAVHCTSMNESNTLISGDNKGYASILFEAKMNPGRLPGKGRFVAAFAQGNEGDVSPNLRGARCLDTGEPCDLSSSTCNGRSQMCVATGPGNDQFESTKILGQRQFLKAWELFRSATTRLRGPVQFQQQYVDMSDVHFELNGQKVHTCRPAMGHSFAAGTTDGPGMFDFRQGTKQGQSSTFWTIARNFLRRPTEVQEQCHRPKPILLSTGEMKYPYPWQPSIVDLQVLRVGKVIIVAVPGEFTTMAGRRVRHAVKEAVNSTPASKSIQTPEVVIAGLSNTYTGYVTTFEEYQLQRYEAASTIYGPHTLSAYLGIYSKLVKTMLQGQKVSSGPTPPNLMGAQISLLPGVVLDTAPSGRSFGSVVHDVRPTYSPGSIVSAVFVCGHPRNNLQLESSFLVVEKLRPDNTRWSIIASDANWETKFFWTRTSSLLGQSQCTVEWDIPVNTANGTYRLRHFGFSKSLMGEIRGYSGSSSRFEVKPASSQDRSDRRQNRQLKKIYSFWG